MDERRKKHGWPFWFAAGLFALVLYIASFALTFRFASTPGGDEWPAKKWLYVYAPLVLAVRSIPGGDVALLRFAAFLMPPGTAILFPTGPTGVVFRI